MSSGQLDKNINIKREKTITLPDVLNGCETWFLVLKRTVGELGIPALCLKRHAGSFEGMTHRLRRSSDGGSGWVYEGGSTLVMGERC